MGVHANLLIACTQVAGETGLTGIVIFLTEIEPQHGTVEVLNSGRQNSGQSLK